MSGNPLCEVVFDIKKEIGEQTHLVVRGWSMRPLIEFGDTVVVDHSAREFRPGDVIAYRRDTRIIIHRVIRRFDVNGRIVYLGKGDSNSKIDPRISGASILGKVQIVIKRNDRTFTLDKPFWRFVGRAFTVWIAVARFFPAGGGGSRRSGKKCAKACGTNIVSRLESLTFQTYAWLVPKVYRLSSQPIGRTSSAAMIIVPSARHIRFIQSSPQMRVFRDLQLTLSRTFMFALLVTVGANLGLPASRPCVLVTHSNELASTGPYQEFPLLPEDRYFWIENHGLTRVYVDLNGHRFTLTVDPSEVPQGKNMYLMPTDSAITFDMALYMQPENNVMQIFWRGPPDSDATVVVADQVINGRIDYVLHLDALPKSLALVQNFPNPFNLSTTIQYEIPDDQLDGVDVELTLFDVLGRTVRTLVRDHRFHGLFTVQWDGLTEMGSVAASGVYLYRMKAGDFSATKRLVLTK